ncbi:MAG: SDR family oxidoreductase [Anaerolineales bacterium]|nr:SDR family oxidoreductase [Anaerolineales bacterium]
MKVKGKVFLVTGGGSGIGRALVIDLVNRGAEVAALDINADTLEETKALAGELGDKISTHIVNVSDREAVEKLPEKMIEKHGAIDGIINNAGIIQPFVPVKDLDYETIDRVMSVNLLGPLYVTKTFLPHLLVRPEGHIVNVSSMGGFFPFPGQTIYGATKAGVKLLTEGLHSELSDTNVRVTVVFPGAIETNINKNSGITMERQSENGSSALKPLPAEEAARMIIDGIEVDKYSILVGNDAKVMDKFYRISPRRAAGFINKQMKGLIAQ